jgi:hypothetical protein
MCYVVYCCQIGMRQLLRLLDEKVCKLCVLHGISGYHSGQNEDNSLLGYGVHV